MVDKLERFLQERIDNYRSLMDECVEAGTDENGYALAVEALQRVQQDAARIVTPTEDARERVKVLEEALGLALHYLVQSEPGDSRAVSDEFVAMAAIHAGLGGEKAIAVIRNATALGNKETDRHG